MTDFSFGSPRLPSDPPAELDNMPAGQLEWIRIAGSNAALRDLDFDLLLIYCQEHEFIARMEKTQGAYGPESDTYQLLARLISEGREALAEMRAEMYPPGWIDHV